MTAPTALLTPREHDVLLHVAAGYWYAEVGILMNISGQTAKQHAAAMRRKLGARNNAHAVALAYRAGILGGGA